MEKFVKITLSVFVAVAGSLALSEVLVRMTLSQSFILNPGEDGHGSIKQVAMKTFVQEKINVLWSKPLSQKTNFYIPPFEVFVNRGFEDEERLKFIASRSKLPPNQNLKVYSFLRRQEDESSTFTVTSNSLGFRGAEREIKKPERTYRIIVLGSYPAFGHGVSDNETYSAYLEKELNEKSKNKMTFEVWNGGRQGGSSIMGYARLKEEVDAYNPDMIIWDYGWIEPYLTIDLSSKDETFTKPFRMIPRTDFETAALKFCRENKNWLKLCQLIVSRFQKLSPAAVEQGWLSALTHAKAWTKQRQIPLIYLHHPGVNVSEKIFEQAEDRQNKVNYLDTSVCIFGNKLTENELKKFWSKNNWLTEMNYNSETLPENEYGNLYSIDAIQYNSFAYKRVAACLAKQVNEFL
jgi:hypothetical protein